MKSNLGNTDRTVRVILAVLIGAAGLYFKSWWGLVAIVPLVTALRGMGLGIPYVSPKMNTEQASAHGCCTKD